MRILAFLLLLIPTFAVAQGAATLVADSVTLDGEEQLIASGNVEVLYDGARLTAQEIIYDQPSDRLTIIGPIFIRASDGTILTADRATLDPRLENGILQGARLVLQQQLQLVANQIDRSDGRYSQLYKTAATSCRVCGDLPPLWEIRAERVVHDELEKQLYFTNAIVRIRGIPVLWLPRMRLPDPTLERGTGFLIPSQRNTNRLGTGFKFPYFITLGDSRDITVTPYVSAETRTLELVYRQAFINGNLRVQGAVTEDTLEEDLRSYLFLRGNFDLRDSYKLSFDVEVASDPAYLVDYGYSDKDRLDSAFELRRVTETTLSQAQLTYYQTLRDDEDNGSLPPLVASIGYEERLRPAIGGILSYAVNADAIYRYSSADTAAGRDLARVGLRGDWQNSYINALGIVADVSTGVRADYYSIGDDDAFPPDASRIVPTVATKLSWPLVRTTASGTSHLVEPAVGLAWADTFGTLPPNEDSTRSELDRANLFNPSRFPGDDAVETGVQAAFGITWMRVGVEGVTSTLTFGRIVRDRSVSDFSPSSGLDGESSDWLISGQIVAPGGFLLDARGLIDSEKVTRADSRLVWRNADLSLSAAYIWQAADPSEDRPVAISEWSFDAGYDINEKWRLNLDARYDVADDRPIQAGVGVVWRNECVTIDVSASRRYSASSTVEPTTTYGVSGSLSGFSAGRSGKGPSAQCNN